MPSLTDAFEDFDDYADDKSAPTAAAPNAGPPPVPEAPPKKTSGSFYGTELPDEVQAAARAAAEAVDAEDAAKAQYDHEKDIHQAKVDKIMAPLGEVLSKAKERRKEAEEHLLRVMGAEKITKIPMDDRPDIEIKVSKGRKQNVTKKWLSNPEGVVVKKYGPKAPDVIWEAIPRSPDTTKIHVPPRYEDEPST